MRATPALVLACLFSLASLAPAASTGASGTSEVQQAKVQTSFLNLPLRFEVNSGQAASEVQFLTRGARRAVFLLKTGPLFVIDNGRSVASLRLTWMGANADTQAIGEERLASNTNYLLGEDPKHWRAGIPTYARVRYQRLYRNTDLIYYGNQQKLEYDLILRPGADPSQIRMHIAGAKKISVASNGDLLLNTAAGSLRQQRPVVYQRAGTRRKFIRSHYVVRGNEVAIAVGNFDRRRELIIDPVMSFSTLLGGSSEDEGLAIAVDSTGHAFVAGTTISTNFPTTSGAHDRTCGTDGACGPASEPPARDVFVTKLNASGTGLLYSTYLGGSGPDFAAGNRGRFCWQRLCSWSHCYR